MDNPPFFSIVVPVYNVEKYLNACVQSVMCQTFKDFEMILVDDGSPDRCPQMCDEFANNYNSIRVIHKENGGLSDARNSGLLAAKGEYILFLDSDDYWNDENALLKVYKKIDETKADVLIFGMQKYFQNENKFADIRIPVCDKVSVSHAQEIKYLMEQNIFIACAWDKVVKTSFIRENAMNFVKGQLSEDIEWCCRLLLGNPIVTILSEAFYVYRQNNTSSITSNITRKNLEDILNVIIKYAQKDNILLRNFIANQYVLWMTTANRVPRESIKDLIKQAKEYWALLKVSVKSLALDN